MPINSQTINANIPANKASPADAQLISGVMFQNKI